MCISTSTDIRRSFKKNVSSDVLSVNYHYISPRDQTAPAACGTRGREQHRARIWFPFKKMTTEHEGCCCSRVPHSSVHQTLDEMEFERGIWSAALDGDIDKVNKLLREGRDPNAMDSSGYTALHYAARNGHLEVCRALVASNACVNAKTRTGGVTPLHRAAYCGHVPVVQFLVRNKAILSLTDTDNKTALHKACEKGHLEIIKLLLESDCTKTLHLVKDNRDKLAKDYITNSNSDSLRWLDSLS